MNLISLVLLALAMSTDAFAAAIGKGAALGKVRLIQALKIGLLFGVIEAITPLIGWAIGSLASSWVEEWDHWIAFVLLLGLGAHMIWAGLQDDDGDNEADEEQKSQSIVVLALTAVATSIDALAVGIGLAFIDVNIWIAAAAIGTATTTMVTIGVLIGRRLGDMIGKRAEMLGGIVLICVGVTILYEHLAH
jgi:manganese efflux pump family protein